MKFIVSHRNEKFIYFMVDSLVNMNCMNNLCIAFQIKFKINDVRDKSIRHIHKINCFALLWKIIGCNIVQ